MNGDYCRPAPSGTRPQPPGLSISTSQCHPVAGTPLPPRSHHRPLPASIGRPGSAGRQSTGARGRPSHGQDARPTAAPGVADTAAPELEVRSRGLRNLCTFDALEAALEGRSGILVDITLDMVTECRLLTVRNRQLESRLQLLVRDLAPHLTAIPGCGVLSAAAILGETAGAARFKSKDAFARFNGTAPIPVWSSHKVRVRLNRGGNRTVNCALHMIAVTQTRGQGEGAAYYAKQLAAEKTPKEALTPPTTHIRQGLQGHARRRGDQAADPCPSTNCPSARRLT